MALETKLVQKLSQTLLMTPQLQQAIKLLQLGRLEYLEAIEKELLDNPLLEEMKETDETNQPGQETSSSSDNDSSTLEGPMSSDSSSTGDDNAKDSNEPRVDWEDFLESFTDSRGSATPKGLLNFEERPPLEGNLSKEETLSEYLLSQVRLADIKSEDKAIAAQVVGNLDKDGYLCSSMQEIADVCNCQLTDAERAVDFVKSLDPPGIAAQDLKECLYLQLDSQGRSNCLEAKIVQNHLEKLEKRRFDLIAKAEQVAIEEVYKAVAAIQKLEPRPGRTFAENDTRYVVPDVYVYKVGTEYVISLNEDGLPKLRVSSYYLDLLKSDEDAGVNRSYLNERLKAASWLIRSIHQRQQTIYKVAESIVKFQKEFWDHGISKLKPLVLKDVAENIGMHESTVSRVTTNKYMHTPQGVFELKYFFTTGIKTAEGDVSSSSIKERIKNIIAAESTDDPVSDQVIVEMLRKENIEIARRTVAKYRESLGLSSSAKRKKYF